MKKKRKVVNLFIIVFVVLVLVITIVAFSALSTQLKINGTSTMDTEKWDIYFENLQYESSGGDAEVLSEPTLSATKISGLKVQLSEYGDYVTYTFDIVNNGTMDAKIQNIIKEDFVCTSLLGNVADETLVCNGIEYKLVYTDTRENISISDVLKAGGKQKVTLYLGFNGTSLPINDVNVSGLDINIRYIQTISN